MSKDKGSDARDVGGVARESRAGDVEAGKGSESYRESQEATAIRMVVTALVNAAEAERKDLEAKYGQVWDTKELQRDFVVRGFLSPCVSVTRKSDGKKGFMMFQHQPRYYWGFKSEEELE